ncbi:hypothetical protein ACRE_082960 [Hapsidospora chrysogenum ATCC 11550]|uniref:CFEM domain-containing protein n=1 Tax=Hapsidospora chrysogenum (strain ATCC 11550 / CBS 779.69 / DSM 880 / IAM 14645 / JCM 23072 / IMI 49137) TaxID=857340 RepID=A0A086SV58_HAPC1|nr:hypothetical protein ACRE_082960 [Hapsidospora chrysogenum ATCC 11550]
MQFKATLLAALAAVVVSAQDTSELPACAQPCFLDNVADSGCSGVTDFKCLCSSKAYIDAVTSCTLGACPLDQAIVARQWAVDTCKSVGIDI